MKSNIVENIWERFFVFVTLCVFVFDFNKNSFADSNFQRCWPHWQGCRSLAFPADFPYSYAYTTLFAGILLILCFSFWAVIANKQKHYLGGLWLLTLFKIFFFFIWRFHDQHNFAMFHLLPTLAFLINKENRIFAGQVVWCLCYFLAGLVKVSDGWIVGTYFSNLELGLPFVPLALVPLATNFIFFAETTMGWTLLSRKWGRSSFWFWTFFHVYSAILVGFYYPIRCLAMMWALFLPHLKPDFQLQSHRTNRLNLGTILLISFLVLLHMVPFAFNEDPKWTLRWQGYGFNMFDANYQCVTEMNYTQESKIKNVKREIAMSRFRCSPALALEDAKNLCESTKNAVSLSIIKSVNGSPFYKIVDLKDACNEKFSLLGANEWINKNPTQVEGYPVPNAISGAKKMATSSSIISDRPSLKLSPMQNFLAEYLRLIQVLYFIFWIFVIIYMAKKYFNSLKSKLT